MTYFLVSSFPPSLFLFYSLLRLKIKGSRDNVKIFIKRLSNLCKLHFIIFLGIG
jgi:hypothetical protein